MPRSRACAAAFSALVIAAPGPAAAHHAMDGTVPATIWEGFVSGLAHPVIGLDHLAFLVAAGVLAAGAPRAGGRLSLVAFLGLGLVGALLHLAGWGLGVVEVVVALSVLIAGIALLAPARPGAATPFLLPLAFALAGLFHGHAYAEAIAGAPAGVVIVHLAALSAMQAGLAGLVMAAARHLDTRLGDDALHRRGVGVTAAAVGMLALVGALLP